MKKIVGTFIGTGASLKIALGFQPDRVLIQNLAEADRPFIVWSKHDECGTAACDGVLYQENTKVAQTNLTVGTGVRRYAGGDLITVASAAAIMPASDIPLLSGDMRNRGTLGIADTWTLDTAGNRTGHLNRGIDTDLVGVGSRILVSPADRQLGGETEAAIVAITSDGDAANNITLTRAVASGRVSFISYKYDFGQAPAGVVLAPGIVCAEATHVNASGQLCYIEAECYG